jgi:hypothetical protein
MSIILNQYFSPRISYHFHNNVISINRLINVVSFGYYHKKIEFHFLSGDVLFVLMDSGENLRISNSKLDQDHKSRFELNDFSFLDFFNANMHLIIKFEFSKF